MYSSAPPPPPPDAFGELRTMIDESEACLKEAYSDTSPEDFIRGSRQILQPILQAAKELKLKAGSLRAEHDNAKLIDELKAKVYHKCNLIGEDPAQYVSFQSANGAVIGFRESVEQLRFSLNQLGQKVYRRVTEMNEIINKYNKIDEELEEGSAIATIALPDDNPRKKAVKVTRYKVGKAKQTAFESLYGGNIMSDEALQESEDPDLTNGHLDQLKHDLQMIQMRKTERITMLGTLAQDIIRLWREDSHIPAITDETSTTERQLILFAKSGKSNVNEFLTNSSTTLKSIVVKKKTLLDSQAHRIKATLEMSKRLKLVEDRQYVLTTMRKFEARAANPLRLFGDSTILKEESRFRSRMYPRLLLIESVLRPALLLYQERHKRPFMYQGKDYLEILDNDLRTRKIPREVFPLSFNSGQQQHFGSLSPMPESILECIGGVAESLQTDFARVLQASVTIDDIIAEKVMANSEREEDIYWNERYAGKTQAEFEAEAQERKLLKLGWQLPDDLPPQALQRIRPSDPEISYSSPQKAGSPSSKKTPTRSGSAPRTGKPKRPSSSSTSGAKTSRKASPRKPLIPNLSPTKLRDADQGGSGSEDDEDKKNIPSLESVVKRPDFNVRKDRRYSTMSDDPNDVFATPEKPRILKAKHLKPKTARGAEPKRVMVRDDQLANIRKPREPRFAESPSAKALKARVDAAYRR